MRNDRLEVLVQKYKVEADCPTIFLSGAMTGLSQKEQTGWREALKERFVNNYQFFDPTVFDAEDESDEVQQLAHEYDICGIINCDYFVVNLNKAKTSVGTCQEIMLAWLLGKDIIGFFENEDLVEPLHPWIENKLNKKFKRMDTLIMFLILEYYKKWWKGRNESRSI